MMAAKLRNIQPPVGCAKDFAAGSEREMDILSENQGIGVFMK